MSVSISLADTDAAGQPMISALWSKWLAAGSILVPLPFMILMLLDFNEGQGRYIEYYSFFFSPYVIIWPFFIFGWMLLLRKIYGIKFPPFESVKPLYDHNFDSGEGTPGFLGILGHASSALKIVITEDELWTTAWFPFSCLVELCGLEHRIVKRDILHVRVTSGVWVKQFAITYQSQEGEVDFRVTPWKTNSFAQALDHDGSLRAAGKLHLE